MKLNYILTAGLLFITSHAISQAFISKAQRNSTIDTLITILNNRYIYPETAKKTATFILNKHRKKQYEKLTNANAFAQQLTNDMQQVSHDKHLRIEYSADIIPQRDESNMMSIPPGEMESAANMFRHINYGIRKVDVLRGNIGYIDFELLCGPEFAGEAYEGMMKYLAHTEALIIDLRACGGSRSPDAVPFLCSYFFEKPVNLGDVYWRDGNKITSAVTKAKVNGPKYLDKPIYILVSNATFSGAELMAFSLQKHKRATIIGMQTGGGGNPGGYLRVNNHFQMFVPIGRPVGESWEGIGVKPDSIINTRLALNMAQQLAMQNSINTTNEIIWRNALTMWKQELEASKPVLKKVKLELKGYPDAKEVLVAGTFNDWSAGSDRMIRRGDTWTATVESEAGQQRYKFVVDGQWITDPANKNTVTSGENIDSVLMVQ